MRSSEGERLRSLSMYRSRTGDGLRRRGGDLLGERLPITVVERLLVR